MTTFALASCSGGSAPVPSGVTFGSSTVSAATQKGTGTLVIRVIVPHAAHRDRVRIVRAGHPEYVSASTAAMRIALQVGSKTVTTLVVPLTATSPGCTKTSSGTTCVANVVLPACTTPGKCYTAVVSTFDAVFCNGAPPVCKIPSTAGELSAGQSLPFRIATGKGNAISLTLSGVPHSMTISPDALTRANGGTFDLIGPGAHAFTMRTFDADGNAIVGPGAPTVSVSVPTGSLAPITLTTPSSSPGEVWVAPPTTLDTTNVATFEIAPTFAGQSVDGCMQPGANCAPTSVTVGMEQMAVFLGANGVLEFFALDETAPRLSLTGFDATANGLTADAAGDIFTPNGLVAVYTPPLSAGTKTQPACCPGTTTMAVSSSSSGRAVFLSYYSTAAGLQNVVSSCSVTTCSAEAYVLSYNVNQTFASDAAGDLAYGNPGSRAPGSMNCFAYVYPASNYRAAVLLAGTPLNVSGCAQYVAMDVFGNAFVSDSTDNQIVEYSKTSDYKTATRISVGQNASVAGMLTDSSGDLFDVIGVTTPVPYYPYSELAYTYLQETLASSLNANQGGMLNPDRSSSEIQGGTTNALMDIGPNEVYVEPEPAQPYPLWAFILPSLTQVDEAPRYSGQATGMLVLP